MLLIKGVIIDKIVEVKNNKKNVKIDNCAKVAWRVIKHQDHAKKVIIGNRGHLVQLAINLDVVEPIWIKGNLLLNSVKNINGYHFWIKLLKLETCYKLSMWNWWGIL